MSTVTYNGIELPYPLTTQFSQKAVGDDLSNTDWQCTEFDIKVQCLINSNYLDSLAPELLGDNDIPLNSNPADIMNVVRSKLLKRRRTLSVRFNGIELIPQATGGPGTVDVKNGPVPQACDLVTLTNNTFLMNYHIVARYWENNTINPGENPVVDNEPGNSVLYNRWTETVDIDQANYTTYTREGKFIIRSDNKDGQIADQLRGKMAIVMIKDGMIRVSSRYTVSQDGLGIAYNFVDKEVQKLPPDGVFSAEGTYTESTSANEAKRHADVRVTLRGDKRTKQTRLIELAVGICAGKILRRGQLLKNAINKVPGGKANKGVLVMENASVVVDMYDNKVSCTMRALMANDPLRLKGINAFVGIDTETPESNNQTRPPQHLLRGTQGMLLRAAAYYDPSLRNYKMTDNEAVLEPGLEVGRAGFEKEK